MKGDTVEIEVPCPLAPLCRIVLHPRRMVTGTSQDATPRRTIRAALFRHFEWTHPSITGRERSLLLDRAVADLLGMVP